MEAASRWGALVITQTMTEAKMGAPVFNDSDLQMAGYAAALKVRPPDLAP